MFDSVLHRGDIPKARFGSGALISVVVHVALFWTAVYFSSMPVERADTSTEVKFVGARPPPPPPPPPPPAGGGTPTPKVEKKVEKKPTRKVEIVQPTEIPKEKPKEAEPEPEPEKPAEPEPGGQVGGVEGGVEGGTVGGQLGGVIGGTVGGSIGGSIGSEVMPFGEGMTRPQPLSGNRAPQYTREALEAKIQGLMLVKCVITVEGELKNCRVIKPLPHMETAVLDTLSTWKFTPVTYQGRAISVEYVIPVRLVIPR